MEASVRTVVESELHEFFRTMRLAFLGDWGVTDEQVAWWAKSMDLSRTWAGLVDGRVRGTARSFPTQLSVPGGSLPAAAVTQVTVAPTHTRRGLLTRLMRASLEDARDRGEPLAILVASEWPIYGRFGYGPATERVGLSVDTRRARFSEAAVGRVEVAEPEEFRRRAPGILARAAGPGHITRDERWWDGVSGLDPMPGRPEPSRRVRVLWTSPGGEVDGYAIYNSHDDWRDGRPEGRLEVLDLAAASPDAYRGLWAYLCGVDLVAEVEARSCPVDDPLPLFLVDGRAVRQRSRSDHLWVRLVDPAAALAGRTYAAVGRLVLEVDDAFWGRNARLTLEGGPTGATCRPAPASAEPDLALGVSALGAAFLGGTSFSALARAGLARPASPDAVVRADAMFAVRPAPFLTSPF